MRRVGGDLPREGKGVVERLFGQSGDETELGGLDAADHPAREGQLLGDVGPHDVLQQLRAGHVGDQTPDDLAHGESGFRVDDAQVGAERDLEAAAVGHAVDRGDHGNGHRMPAPGRELSAVGGVLVGPLDQLTGRGVAVSALLHRAEAAEVEAGAESAAVAGEHDRAHRGIVGKFAGGGGQTLEHRVVQRVHLVGAVETDVGDAGFDVDGEAGAGGYIGHEVLRVLVWCSCGAAGCCARRSRSGIVERARAYRSYGSAQPRDLSTARCQPAARRSRSAGVECGSNWRSRAQFLVTSSWSAQKPTARPAR